MSHVRIPLMLLHFLLPAVVLAQPAGRVPWTTSRVTGSPDAPPAYRTERAFPALRFDQPVTIARVPGSRRLLVAELNGRLVTFPDDPDVAAADLFLDLSQVTGHWRTYGVAFHPDFARNRLVYVCYVLKGGNPKGSRVVRFRVSDTDPPQADLDSQAVVIDWLSGGHNGGCLQFGPDGMLYVSTGDGSDPSPPDRHDTGQNISDLLGSILRIDVDRPDPGRPYGVPPDNPFVKLPGARPEVWAYGLRNPWKMAFDPADGSLWVGDVGWEMWEMIYRVERGGNYGWSVIEGAQTVRPEAKRGPTPILPATVQHDHTEARSITGGRAYHGKALKDLAGAYVYGDYVTGKLWALRHDGRKVTWHKHLADSPLEVIDFADDTRGELLILEHGGTVNRLVPNPAAHANAAFPQRLSETGLFASVKDHAPAPGVLPYAVNVEPWADHATAERLLAIPGTGTLGVQEKHILQAGMIKGAWTFPDDTVLTRTLTLPAGKRRIETQLLHQDRGTWRAYTYAWNDAQTDAELVGPAGQDRTVAGQAWHFAGRTECLVCHTTRAGSILGFNAAQLNRVDQLARLRDLGLFEKPLPDPLPHLPDPYDSASDLDRRARAYLHTNCASCHRRGGGGTAAFELLYEFDLKKTHLVGSRPTQGTFGIHAAENVAPGDPYRSVLYYRMAKLGPGRMPHASSSVVDERGLDLIHDWIVRLPEIAGVKPDRPSSVTDEQRVALETLARTGPEPAAIDRLLANPSAALYLLRALDTGRLSPPARDAVLRAVAVHTDSQVRDLFERFLPEGQRTRRLGNVIDAAAILAMSGDVERGRQAFLKGTIQCRNCHRVAGEGTEVGPDLTTIGKKLDRPKLLESLLEPSKTIEPAYVTFLAETSRGGVVTGLLLKKTPEAITLRDAQGKLVTLPAGDVDVLVPQPRSLMPEGLLRDRTAQEVADLLAFLAALR